MVNGIMVLRMDLGLISIKMELSIKDSGEIIYSMERGGKNGQMAQHSRGSMKTVRKKEEEFLNGEMALCMLECFKKINFTVKDYLNGLMAENTKVLGLKFYPRQGKLFMGRWSSLPRIV